MGLKNTVDQTLGGGGGAWCAPSKFATVWPLVNLLITAWYSKDCAMYTEMALDVSPQYQSTYMYVPCAPSFVELAFIERISIDCGQFLHFPHY